MPRGPLRGRPRSAARARAHTGTPYSRSAWLSDVLRSVDSVRWPITSAHGVAVLSCRKPLRQGPRDHRPARGSTPGAGHGRLLPVTSTIGGRGREHDARAEHRPLARASTPSTSTARDPTKQSSSTITGRLCGGSSTPPIPTPPERCTRRADLGAGADGGPGVDHGALADARADVDVGRHHDHAAARGSCRSAPRPAAPRARRAAARSRLSGILSWNSNGPTSMRLRDAQPEVERDRLLDPAVRDPRAVALLGDPQPSPASSAAIAPRPRRAPPASSSGALAPA